MIEARRERSTGVLVENDEGEARWAITYREDGTAEKIEVFDGTNRFIREDRLRRKQGATNKLIVNFEQGDAPLTQASMRGIVYDPLQSTRPT